MAENVKVGIQLYTLREFAEKDYVGMLEGVKRLGYDAVEFAGYGGLAAGELKRICTELGLDPVSTKEVKTLIKALAAGGMTILMTSHLLADAEDVCDRVAIVNHGKVVAEGDIESLDSSLEDFFLAKVGDEKKFALAGFLTEGQRS